MLGQVSRLCCFLMPRLEEDESPRVNLPTYLGGELFTLLSRMNAWLLLGLLVADSAEDEVPMLNIDLRYLSLVNCKSLVQLPLLSLVSCLVVRLVTGVTSSAMPY